MYVTFSYVPGFDNNIAMDIKPCQHVLDNKIFSLGKFIFTVHIDDSLTGYGVQRKFKRTVSMF